MHQNHTADATNDHTETKHLQLIPHIQFTTSPDDDNCDDTNADLLCTSFTIHYEEFILYGNSDKHITTQTDYATAEKATQHVKHYTLHTATHTLLPTAKKFKNIYTLSLIKGLKTPEKVEIIHNELKYDSQGATLYSHKTYVNNTEPNMKSESTQCGQVFLKRNKVVIVSSDTKAPDAISRCDTANPNAGKQICGSIENKASDADKNAQIDEKLDKQNAASEYVPTQNDNSSKKHPQTDTRAKQCIISALESYKRDSRVVTPCSKQSNSIDESDKGSSRRHLKKRDTVIPKIDSTNAYEIEQISMEYQNNQASNTPSMSVIQDSYKQTSQLSSEAKTVKPKINQSMYQFKSKPNVYYPFGDSATKQQIYSKAIGAKYQCKLMKSPLFMNGLLNDRKASSSSSKKRPISNQSRTSDIEDYDTDIDWSNSVLYYNIKNGITSFNYDKKEDAYYEYEIEYIIKVFNTKEGADDHIKPFQDKIKRTLQKLANELCVPKYFNHLMKLYCHNVYSDTVMLFEKAKELFEIRSLIVPMLSDIADRELLVNKDITYLINKPHESLDEHQAASLVECVKKLGKLNDSIVERMKAVLKRSMFLKCRLYMNRIVSC